MHNKYALASAFLVSQLDKFSARDTICGVIARYYTNNPRHKINPAQLSTLKERMPNYAQCIIDNGGLTEKLLDRASDCTYDSMCNSTDTTSVKGLAYLVDHCKIPIIGLRFPFDPATIEAVRKLDNPKYDNASKSWKIRATIDNVEQLEKLGFKIDDNLDIWYRNYCYRFYPEPDSDFRIRHLKKDLFDFQKEGIAYVISRNNRALIGDEMGLGKTPQGIGWAQYLAPHRPVLVICTASLKYNWAKEIKNWVNNPTIYVLEGTPSKNKNHMQIFDYEYLYHQGSESNIYIIVNYNVLPNEYNKYVDEEGKKVKQEIKYTGWVDFLKRAEIQVAILDEVQNIKNKEAQRSVATYNLCKNIPYILALSGTPIENKPIEFYNVLNLLNPFQFSNKLDFAIKYCGAVHNGFGWDFSGATNLKELHKLVSSSIMIRRLKSEVLTQLPPKMRSIVDIDIDNRKEYKKAETDIIGWLRKNGNIEKADTAKKAEALVKINVLMQLSLQGKIKNCIDWIHTYLETNRKLVVFVTHRKTIDILLKEFGHAAKSKTGIAVEVDGSVSSKVRQEYVDLFQTNDRCRLFIGNIIAASAGITLTEAADTCFIELAMVPGLHLQAEDRVHRIGQLAESVCAYYLIARGTFEEDVAQLLSEKYNIIKATLDGVDLTDEEIKHQEVGMLSELTKRIIL